LTRGYFRLNVARYSLNVMRPLFSSDRFTFMASSGGEIFVECLKCSQEASLKMTAPDWDVTVSCRKCHVTKSFKFRWLEVPEPQKSVGAS
jgi:hypothetical protein